MHAHNTLLWVKHHEKSPSPERNPIGRRTESDRAANGIRSGGGRKPIGRRTESDWTADGALRGGVHLSPLGFAACQSKKCTNKAILK